MKLGRFSLDGDAVCGVLEDEEVLVLDGFDSFADVLEAVMDDRDLDGGRRIPIGDADYLPPTTPANTAFCAALNYESHVEEADRAIPERPWIFLKLYRSLIGHHQPIKIPQAVSTAIDYEAELTAVIGKPAYDVAEADALDYLAGYTILNDISARDVQSPFMIGDSEYMDWFSGKALQALTPVGPSVVTADTIADPQDLRIRSRLNGEVMQDESSGLMIRSIAELVSYLSTRVELQPGDLIATGTPEGVGKFQDISLEPGDTIDVDIEDIGTLSNDVT